MSAAAAPAGEVSVRHRLSRIAIAAIAPLAVIAVFGLVALVEQQREQAARAGIELTRALATAVGAELGRSISVLQAMATSPTLDHGDFVAFHPRASRVVATQRMWHAILLVDAAGTVVLDTRVPPGAPVPPLADPESLERVRRTGSAVVGNLQSYAVPGAERAEPAFGVWVPVMRDEQLQYTVVGLVDPEAILEILKRQRVPADWVISVFDAGGRRVARSRLQAELLGKPAAPSLAAVMAQSPDEGWGRTIAVEGDRIYTAFSRVKDVGWTVATGVPEAMVDRAVWRTGLILGAGFLVSLAIGLWAALGVARSIAVPIAALRGAAEALGRREPFAPPETPIQEIRRVADALVDAADERLRGERERDELLRREQAARAAAEAANRAKDEFLAMLGHELRNPLSAVTSAVALLDHEGLAPQAAARARQIIVRQTHHLARLTDDLLDAGRTITGKIVLERHAVDLADVVARALATVDVGRRRVVRALMPAWVDGDATRLEQIVVNLLGNAAKYTDKDGTITVSVGREADVAVLRVCDDGVGMTPELTARIFDLFVQGDRPLDRASGGLGIGLTLVQRLAELHGGSASAASAGPGRGSEITVRLPAISGPALAPDAPTVAADVSDGGRDVLVVEDNDDARAALCELLRLAGHRVRSERDGTAGLATALAAHPEIVLVDIGLPGIDGYEVARRIRAAGAGAARMMLIAVTGYGLPEDRTRALEAGFDVHLVKPVSMRDLADVLARRADAEWA